MGNHNGPGPLEISDTIDDGRGLLSYNDNFPMGLRDVLLQIIDTVFYTILTLGRGRNMMKTLINRTELESILRAMACRLVYAKERRLAKGVGASVTVAVLGDMVADRTRKVGNLIQEAGICDLLEQNQTKAPTPRRHMIPCLGLVGSKVRSEMEMGTGKRPT